MPVQRFRARPVEVDAIRFTGKNMEEINQWTGGFQPPTKEEFLHTDITAEIWDFLHRSWIGVKDGQWIVKGAKGEFSPCDDETFHWKYEEVKEEDDADISSAIDTIRSSIALIRSDADDHRAYDNARISTLEDEAQGLEDSRENGKTEALTSKQQDAVDEAQVIAEENEGGTVPKEDFERNWKNDGTTGKG